MREIKFRGFSKTLNKWIIGVPYFSEGNWWILVDENTKSDDIGTGSYFVDKNSIGQYTGLKDKNGVEIYEGNIVIFRKGYVEDCWTDNIQGKHGVVKLYKNNGYGVMAEFIRNKFGGLGYLLPEGEHFEVVGNIYENKELLLN